MTYAEYLKRVREEMMHITQKDGSVFICLAASAVKEYVPEQHKRRFKKYINKLIEKGREYAVREEITVERVSTTLALFLTLNAPHIKKLAKQASLYTQTTSSNAYRFAIMDVYIKEIERRQKYESARASRSKS